MADHCGRGSVGQKGSLSGHLSGNATSNWFGAPHPDQFAGTRLRAALSCQGLLPSGPLLGNFLTCNRRHAEITRDWPVCLPRRGLGGICWPRLCDLTSSPARPKPEEKMKHAISSCRDSRDVNHRAGIRAGSSLRRNIRLPASVLHRNGESNRDAYGGRWRILH